MTKRKKAHKVAQQRVRRKDPKVRARYRQYDRDRRERDQIGRMLQGAKRRSILDGVRFNLTRADIVIPKRCPVFGTIMKRCTRYAPSLDRLNNRKGYVRGNVQVISWRANNLKSDATAAELRKIVDWMESVVPSAPGIM